MNVVAAGVEFEGRISQQPLLTQCVQLLAKCFTRAQFVGIGFVQAKTAFIHSGRSGQARSGQGGGQVARVAAQPGCMALTVAPSLRNSKIPEA